MSVFRDDVLAGRRALITGGGSGFTEAEQEYLIRALSGHVPGKGAEGK